MTNYITKGIGGFYYVKTETGIVECRARGIFRKRGITPVAGDQVVLSADRTTIDEILPRKNVFIRPPDRKSTRLNSSHDRQSRMPSSA